MLSQKDKDIITAIVTSYPAEIRLVMLQKTFLKNISPIHYVYMGFKSGLRANAGQKFATFYLN